MNKEQNNFNTQGSNGIYNEQIINNTNTQQNVNYNQSLSKSKKNNLVLLFVGIGAFIVGFVIIFVAIFFFAFNNSDKLVCKSAEGDITIMYNDETITGYTAIGITYNLDEQKQVAEQIGTDAYVEQFTTWFSTNTSGNCTIDSK